MSGSTRHGIGALLSFLFITMVLIALSLRQTNPTLVKQLSIGLIVFGAPPFIYGLITQRKYQNIFDYEATEFLGKQSTGMRVRSVLITYSTIGLWCLGTGIAFAMIAF